jgi:GAF domain-containing protein
MTKLNQIIAVLNGNTGRKAVCQKAVTAVYQTLQKPAAFAGIARSYRPLQDDGEKFPPENKAVAAYVVDLLNEARQSWTTLFDTVATQDAANTIARADVCVDGSAVLKDVPVTNLMFLEKQLTDIHTALQAIPTLSDEHEWVWSDNSRCYVTSPSDTGKVKKVDKVLVLYAATKEHPAQVKVTTDDVLAGYWTTILQSGAMPKQRKVELLARILRLLDGVRKAREQANEMTITDVSVGDAIFDYVLNGNMPSAK